MQNKYAEGTVTCLSLIFLFKLEGSPLRSPVASGADTNELINQHHRKKASGLRCLLLCCSH